MSKMIFVAAAAASLLCGPALADGVQTAVVRTGHVNFEDRAQVQAFFTKINAMARTVCSAPSPDRIFARSAPDQDCVDRAVAEAVQQIHQPLLTVAFNNSPLAIPHAPAKALATNDQ